MKTSVILISIGLIGVIFSVNFIEDVPLKYIAAGLFLVVQYSGVYMIIKNRIKNKQTEKLILPLSSALLILVFLCTYLLFLQPK